MGITLMTLNSSLRIGKYFNTIQWDTMRKIPTWWTNVFESVEKYGEGAIHSSNDKKVYDSTRPHGQSMISKVYVRGKEADGGS